MSPQEILSLPIRDRRNVIDALDDKLGFLKQLKQENYELPSDLEWLYEKLEAERVRKLPKEERLKLFNETKLKWCEKHPDFKEISQIMSLYKTSETLIEFGKQSVPESIMNKALIVFKKSLSFKVSIADKKLLKGLSNSRYRFYNYCINRKIANNFQDEFLDWGIEISNLGNKVYYLKEDYFNNTGYDRTSWETYIKYPSMLEKKKDDIKKQLNKVLGLIEKGEDLIKKNDKIITEEYEKNGTEMSLYERELEISRIVDLDNENDEQYCYVYTLECELFVFYVGIASNPKERFEQHVRGAFSNESHLFKSKFIQKYNNQIKQNIVYEGIRRDCKLFEKIYISEHKPLGNMTEGGEG